MCPSPFLFALVRVRLSWPEGGGAQNSTPIVGIAWGRFAATGTVYRLRHLLDRYGSGQVLGWDTAVRQPRAQLLWNRSPDPAWSSSGRWSRPGQLRRASMSQAAES